MCHRKILGKYWQLDDVLESALRLNLTHITAIQPSPLSLRFGMFSQDHTCPILANSIFPYSSHFSSIFHAVVCRYKTMLTQLFVLSGFSVAEPRNPMKWAEAATPRWSTAAKWKAFGPKPWGFCKTWTNEAGAGQHWSHPEPSVIMGRVTQFTKGWSQKCNIVQLEGRDPRRSKALRDIWWYLEYPRAECKDSFCRKS